jgi:hypothetical protein
MPSNDPSPESEGSEGDNLGSRKTVVCTFRDQQGDRKITPRWNAPRSGAACCLLSDAFCTQLLWNQFIGHELLLKSVFQGCQRGIEIADRLRLGYPPSLLIKKQRFSSQTARSKEPHKSLNGLWRISIRRNGVYIRRNGVYIRRNCQRGGLFNTNPLLHVRSSRGALEHAFGSSANKGGLDFSSCTLFPVDLFFRCQRNIFAW